MVVVLEHRLILVYLPTARRRGEVLARLDNESDLRWGRSSCRLRKRDRESAMFVRSNS